MGSNFLKFKIRGILFLISFFQKVRLFISWISEKIDKLIEIIFLFVIKTLILLTLPFYQKIRKFLNKNLINFHYQSKILSFFNQKWLILFCFLLIFIFIFFEGKSPIKEEFFVQATIFEEEIETNHPDFEIALEEFESEEAVLKPQITFEKEFIPTRTEIEKYIVEEGDTISSIARDFGVSVNTILWENKLSPYSIIRPGQVLKILPVSGLSHKVKPGETVEKIAQFYRAEIEDIIRFNDLEEKPLKIGDLIIVPEGKIPPPPPAPRIFAKKDKIWLAELGETKREGTGCRNFYPGQCTWYVAQKICIPWSGHAKSWLGNAQKYGYTIGKEPEVGAIISLRETWYGHVGIVEEIKENTIVFSEMNHLGPWKINKREISKNDRRINGYIYLK